MPENAEIYLDHVAAAPVRPQVAAAMAPLLGDGFGNPQSIHSRGQRAAEALSLARERVAALVGAGPAEVIFTANGTEANNMALRGLALGRAAKSQRIVISAIEHHSIMQPARALAKEGFELVVLPVDGHGLVDPAALEATLSEGAAVVSIIHASTEIGTIQPLAELAAVCSAAGVPLHSDAWGSAGMIAINLAALGAGAMTIAAQNFGGPPGAAALVLARGTRLRAIMHGGAQERNLRPGQENLPAIAGMGVAAELAAAELETTAAALLPVRDAYLERLPARIPDVIVTGHPRRRLPGHASFCVKYIEGEGLLLLLDRQGIRTASGSACTSRALKGSHVLEALGLDSATAQGSLQLTLGPTSRLEDVETVLATMEPIVSRLREMSPLYRKKAD